VTADHDHDERHSMAFLSLEHAAPMHLGAVLILTPAAAQDAVTPEGVAEVLGCAGLAGDGRGSGSPPVVSPPGGATWTEDPGFDVQTHTRTHHVPSGGWDAVSALTADLMRRPLDLDRPPWKLHVLGGLDGGRVQRRRVRLLA
jgi:diacylglycerol O-acyltransferase